MANIKYFDNHFLRHAGKSYAISEHVDPTTLAENNDHNKEIMFNNYIHSVEKSNNFFIQFLNGLSVPQLY